MAAIIAAGGRGSRSGGGLPKQFREIAGRPMIVRSARAFLDSGCDPVVVAAPQDHLDATRALFADEPVVEVVAGGPTRRASVAAALERVTAERVLVHDAARPMVPPRLVEEVIAALERADAVIPAIEVDETLKQVEDLTVTRTVDRRGLWSVQTPQGFRTALLRRAHSEIAADDAADDAVLVERLGGSVAVVQGSRYNLKVTREEDFAVVDALAASDRDPASIRVGHGFDVHAFTDGRPLVIGGVHVPHERGLAGHSDADVLSHAVADAILGATGVGDLGAMFPPTDRWREASSIEILAAAAQSARDRGWSVANVDSTVVAERPRLSPFTEEMAALLAAALAVAPEAVSVKATTTDGLGSTGRGEGIAAHAVVLLSRLG